MIAAARSLVLGVLAGSALALAFAVVAPLAAGWRPLTVMSGSMEPTISTGDVVVTQPVDAAAARPGSVITFRDPTNDGRLVTHRLQRRAADGSSQLSMTTRGDANNASEQWSIPPDGRVGVVRYRIPRIGIALVPISSPVGRVALLGVPLLLWGALSVRSIWVPAHA